MGIVCCYDNSPQLEFSKSATLNQSVNVLDMKNQVNFIQKLGEANIKRKLNTVPTFVNSYPYKEKPNQLLNDVKIPFYPVLQNFWAKLTPLDSGNQVHHYLTISETPFTPEMIYLYQLNMNKERFQKLDESIDDFMLLNYQVTEDKIILITATKTKKILMIQPRFFVVVRVIQLNPDHSITEYQESIQNTVLNEEESVKSFLEQFDNLGNVIFNATQIEKGTECNKLSCYNQIDVLSQVGIKLVQGTLKTKMKKYQQNFLQCLAEFVLLEKDYNNLIWFTNDSKVITQIFDDNRKLFLDQKFDISKLSPEAQAEIASIRKERETKRNSELLVPLNVKTEQHLNFDTTGSQVEQNLLS